MSLIKILSIDGGGIRGIIPGQIVARIEEEFGTSITQQVSYMAGTSTGGILALAYLLKGENEQPKFTANEVVDLYFKRGGEIFDLPFFRKVRNAGGLADEKYAAKGIENALKDYFGDVLLGDLIHPCIVTSYDIRRRQPHFFINSNNLLDKDNFKVRDVARATSAAPTYFEPVNVTSLTDVSYPLIDGGVFINNPSLAAYVNVRSQFDTPEKPVSAKDMAVLSLGTGFSKKSYAYGDAKGWGALGWIKPLIDIMMSGVSDTVHEQLTSIYHTTDKPSQYLRINEKLPMNVDAEMDNVEPENLEALKEMGNELFDEHKSEIANWLAL